MTRMANHESSGECAATDPASDAIPGPVQAAVVPGGVDDSQFRLLAENIPVLCWMADADGYIFWYNRRLHEYCGLTPAQLQGWGWQSVHDPESLPDVMARWTSSILTGEPFDMTFPLRGADGVYRPFLTRIEPYRDADGKIVRWFGVNIDVGAQIEAENALRASNRKLQAIAAEREAILSQLGESVIVTGPDGRIGFINEAAKRLHGVSALGVGPDGYSAAYSLFTEDGAPHPAETLPLTRAVHNLETVIDARWRIRRPDASEVLVIGNAKPVYAGDGTLIGAVLTIRDDTERHAAEVALADAVRVKDVLLHEVNHRVKNSLQLVTSLLMLQAGKAASPELRQSLMEARSRIGVVAAMHQRLYTTELHDRVDLASYLRELALDTIGALDIDRRVRLTCECAPGIFLPLDRAVPLALLTSELLTNAVKYAFPGTVPGTISLTTRVVGGDVEISVVDDGCGLPAGFDPAKASGLGMKIVTALTRQLGGKLAMPAQPRGAAFIINFPHDERHDDAQHRGK